MTTTLRTEVKGADRVDHVTVENTSSKLAFFVHLTILRGRNGGDVKPIFWEDNYISLMPGEKREIAASYGNGLLHGAQPVIRVDGINLPGSTTP